MDWEEVRRLIRTEEDPGELQRKLREMVEEAHPAPVFAGGEKMKMHQFLSRFQAKLCDGIVPNFYDCPVTVLEASENGVMIAIEKAQKSEDR